MLLGADVSDLVRAMRLRAGLSQRELARRTRTSRGRVQSYERGATSPSTSVLDALAEACGLQLRVASEPRTSDLDLLVQQVRAGGAVVPVARLAELGGRLRDAGVRWAVDGATALVLHGTAVPGEDPCVVVEDGLALRGFLTRWMVRGYDPELQERLWEGWGELIREDVQRFLSPGTLIGSGRWELRVVDRLGPVVELRLDVEVDDDGDEGEREQVVLPVVPADSVEAAHAPLAELMDALRVYRRGHG